MNASRFILLAGLFAIIMAELVPAQVTPTPTATVEPDPVKSFKELVTRFPKRTIAKTGTAYDMVNLTFDVKKTDSLMNPVMGIINFTAVGPPDKNLADDRFRWDVQMVFHWQGDHWKFAQMLNRKNGVDFTRGATERRWGDPIADFLKSVQ